MKVKDHSDFNPAAPESFNWGSLDSPALSKLAMHLAGRINSEKLLIANQRNLTPGLREALNAIAVEALL